MAKFMISCIMHNNTSPSKNLISESQNHFLELMKEGYLLMTHINTDWTKCWLLIQAPEKEFIQNLLKTSPLYDSMACIIDELEE